MGFYRQSVFSPRDLLWDEYMTAKSRMAYQCDSTTLDGTRCRNDAKWGGREVRPGPAVVVLCTMHYNKAMR